MSTLQRLLPVIALITAPLIQADYKNPALPVEQRVKSLMSQMTLEEKVAQMDMFGLWNEKEYRESTLVDSIGIGAWMGEITPGKYNELQQLSEKTRLKIPFLFGADAAHGHALLPGATIFPSSISMAATFQPDLVFRCARMAAHEIRNSGNHWTFAPCVDIVHDARWGRTGETYGEDPFLSSVMVSSAVEGYQGGNNPHDIVAACAKHLVGGGASVGGVNHASAWIPEIQLRNDFLPPFKTAIEAGVMTIMPGHNDINGVPMHANGWLLTDIVKKEYGFKGFFITDMGDIENLAAKIHRVATDQKDAVRQGVAAGLDMHMYSSNRSMFIDNLVQLVREGKIEESRIDDAVERILAVKFKLGLFENRYLDESASKKFQQDLLGNRYRKRSPHALALEAARQSIVLLKNDNSLLPLDMGKYRRILVTGPNADNQAILGDWANLQPDGHITTILAGIKQELGDYAEIIFSDSGRLKAKKSNLTVDTTDPITQSQALKEGVALNDHMIRDAVDKAANCDLIIAAIGGYGIRTEWGLRTYGESADRPSIDFYGKQVELIKQLHATGKPVIVVIVNGKPLNNPWITDNIATIVDVWEPGMYGGRALAEILTGKTNPSGKLPITIPKSAGQIPLYYYQTTARYRTGYGLGSERSDDQPAFCFGHGLSYTTFEYKDLKLSSTVLQQDTPLVVKATVRNTGKRGGYETVMVFINDEVSSVVTSAQRLKGFDKVWLEPGEEKVVSIEIPFKEFGLWNKEMKYVVEPGVFEVRVGASSQDIRLKQKIEYSRNQD